MSFSSVFKVSNIYEVGIAHMLISRQLQDLYTRILTPYKMSTFEWLALGVVQNQSVHGGIRVTDLANMFDVKTTYVTSNVNMLKSKGYVRSASDANDARVRLVTITPQGSTALAELSRVFRAEIEKSLKNKVTSSQLASYLQIAQQLAVSKISPKQ